MKLPKKRNGPKLPRTPKGGGAAARLQQFEMERGSRAEPTLLNNATDTSHEPCPRSADDKSKKPKTN